MLSSCCRYDANPAEAKPPTADQVSVKVALANVSVEDIRKVRTLTDRPKILFTLGNRFEAFL